MDPFETEFADALATEFIRRGNLAGRDVLKYLKSTAQGWRFARLDCVATSARLCRYYQERGFRPLEPVTLFGGIYTTRLFERQLEK